MNCIEQAREIYEIGIASAKAGKVLTYREVLDYLGYGPRVRGHAIRYGLELTLIACGDSNLPRLTSIIVEEATGEPAEGGYPMGRWEKDKQEVFNHQEWPPVNDIDWDYVYENRIKLSDTHGTPGYWSQRRR